MAATLASILVFCYEVSECDARATGRSATRVEGGAHLRSLGLLLHLFLGRIFFGTLWRHDCCVWVGFGDWVESLVCEERMLR